MNPRTWTFMLLLSAALMLTVALTTEAEIAYRIQRIELPSGQASDLNNKGEVTATLIAFEGDREIATPVLWRKGKLIDLTRAIGRPGEDSIGVGALNDHSVMTGGASGPATARSFIFRRPHRRIDLPPLANPQGINNRNEVFGVWFGESEAPPFVWRKGQFAVLRGLPGGGSAALGINDRGDVVGLSGGPVPLAVIWREGTVMPLPLLPGAIFAQANAINNLGQVVGVNVISNREWKAFLWSDGTLVELPHFAPECPFTGAAAINDWGVIVGNAIGCRGDAVAFIWMAMRPIALDDLIATDDPLRAQLRFRVTIALNDRGQILTLATDRATSTEHLFALLTPTFRAGALRGRVPPRP